MDHLPKTVLEHSFTLEEKLNAQALQSLYESIIKSEPWREYCKPKFKVKSTDIYIWLDKEKHFLLNIYSGLGYAMSLLYEPHTRENQKFEVLAFHRCEAIHDIPMTIDSLIYELKHNGYQAVTDTAQRLKDKKGASDPWTTN